MSKKKYIQLPAECLSYSQVSSWLSNPKIYMEKYFDPNNNNNFMNKAMVYGKSVADALENYEPTGDLMTDMAIEQLVKLDCRDIEMKSEYKTKYGWLKIVSHPDMFCSKTKALREIKTGMVKWTQKRADNWFQIKFYAMLIYVKHGVVPPSAHLDWIETFRDTDNEIKPTGKVESFEVKITIKDILETMAITTKAAKEIELEWLTYEREPQETLEEWLN